MTLEERILLYPDLPPEERRAVEAAVAGQPELQAMLEEARELHALFEEADLSPSARPGEEALSRYVVSGGLPPEGTDPLADQLRAMLEADPTLREDCEAMEARAAQLADEAEPAEVQFQRLSGRKLSAEPVRSRRSRAEKASSPASRAGDRAAVRGARPAVQRVAFRRVAMSLVLVCGVAYAVLFAAGPTMLSDEQRLADLDEVPVYAGYRLRGPGGESDPTLEAYGEAVQTLQDAHHSTLGLFPRYDAAGLEAAAAQLETIIAETPGAEPLALDARYVLAKIRLYQGDDEAARRQLRAVIQREGPSAPDAERLLEALSPRP